MNGGASQDNRVMAHVMEEIRSKQITVKPVDELSFRQRAFGCFLNGAIGWFGKYPPNNDYERGMKKGLEMAQEEWNQ